MLGVSVALEVTMIVLAIAPTRFVSYFTSIFPVAPGAIGSFGQEGTVHPQLELAPEITSGALPVFLN